MLDCVLETLGVSFGVEDLDGTRVFEGLLDKLFVDEIVLSSVVESVSVCSDVLLGGGDNVISSDLDLVNRTLVVAVREDRV